MLWGVFRPFSQIVFEMGNTQKQLQRRHLLDWAERGAKGVELRCVIVDDSWGDAGVAKELNVCRIFQEDAKLQG